VSDSEIRAKNERRKFNLEPVTAEKEELRTELESTAPAKEEFQAKFQELQRRITNHDSVETASGARVFMLETDFHADQIPIKDLQEFCA
jgi:predicted nuclease with TOPRIM domain